MTKVRVIPNKDAEYVVEVLREALADAEAGRVTGCMVVTISPGNITKGAWGGSLTFHEKLGVLEQMKHRMLAAAKDVT